MLANKLNHRACHVSPHVWRIPEIDHTCRVAAIGIDKLAKVLVFGMRNAASANGQADNVGIGSARSDVSHPVNRESGVAQCSYEYDIAAFIRYKPWSRHAAMVVLVVS